MTLDFFVDWHIRPSAYGLPCDFCLSVQESEGIWIPSDSNSRWTPCLWLTLPAAERVVVSRHLVVLMNGLVCINWRKIGVWRILFKIRKPDLPRHHREKSDFQMIDVKISRASRPPGCGRPPSAGSAFPDRPRGGRRKSTCRRNQCPSSGAAASW